MVMDQNPYCSSHENVWQIHAHQPKDGIIGFGLFHRPPTDL